MLHEEIQYLSQSLESAKDLTIVKAILSRMLALVSLSGEPFRLEVASNSLLCRACAADDKVLELVARIHQKWNPSQNEEVSVKEPFKKIAESCIIALKPQDRINAIRSLLREIISNDITDKGLLQQLLVKKDASSNCEIWFGAVLHGLEDEFHSVRLAACKVLVEIITRADVGLQLLLDMVHDEEYSVRLYALKSLLSLKKEISDKNLVTTQMTDSSAEVRSIILDILQYCSDEISFGLFGPILEKYPQDYPEILSALFKLKPKSKSEYLLKNFEGRKFILNREYALRLAYISNASEQVSDDLIQEQTKINKLMQAKQNSAVDFESLLSSVDLFVKNGVFNFYYEKMLVKDLQRPDQCFLSDLLKLLFDNNRLSIFKVLYKPYLAYVPELMAYLERRDEVELALALWFQDEDSKAILKAKPVQCELSFLVKGFNESTNYEFSFSIVSILYVEIFCTFKYSNIQEEEDLAELDDVLMESVQVKVSRKVYGEDLLSYEEITAVSITGLSRKGDSITGSFNLRLDLRNLAACRKAEFLFDVCSDGNGTDGCVVSYSDPSGAVGSSSRPKLILANKT
ncbi:hypothetical protein MP638_003919 [Amoeboaphelidium occidentale]|nr:hypothetical protein MP638_003919 [Amoeboaphelidium occidentale]